MLQRLTQIREQCRRRASPTGTCITIFSLDPSLTVGGLALLSTDSRHKRANLIRAKAGHPEVYRTPAS